jgi:multiple sugar transport system permease protein
MSTGLSTRDASLSPGRARLSARAYGKLGRQLERIGLHLLNLLVSLFFLSAWIWLILTSLKTRDQIFVWPPPLLPNPIYLQNYADAIAYIPFFRYLANTLIIAGAVVVGRLTSCSVAAYAFSHLRWPGRDVFFLLVLSTMMLPFQVTMIPLYVIYYRLGWVNTFLPLTVPAFLGDAFFIFLLRQFFLTIPHELVEAATIDGSSDLRTFFQIVLPLAQPALATLVVLSFLGAYTDFLGPLLYLTDPDLRTLSLGMQAFVSDFGTAWGALMAAAVLFTLPLVLVYFVTQRRFVEGISTTGLK